MENEKRKAVLNKLFQKDIEAFARFFFPHHLKLKTPAFHREIFADLEGSAKRLALGAPRGHAKSTITDLAYLAWAIVNNKAKFVILISDTYSQATLFLEALKAEFEGNDKLRSFYGDLTSKSWSEGEIVVNGIMVKALGAGMSIRGLKYHESRPDLILIDDLENDDLVASKERREKLERWFNSVVLPSLEKDGRVIVIGTILHYDSLLYHLLSDKKYAEFKKRTYRAITDGKALWEEHLNVKELEEIKQEYVKNGQGYLFYQEYQNDPVSDENRKFKIEKIRYWNNGRPATIDGKMLTTFAVLDRSYSLDKTADFNGFVVVSVDIENMWYIRLAERFKGTEKEVIEKIFDIKQYFSPVIFGIEQKAFEYTIKVSLEDEMRRRNTFFSIQEMKDAGTSKNKRIEGLLPRFETGSIFFLPEQTDLIDEMITFPRGVHDDILDALAYVQEIAFTPLKKTAPLVRRGLSGYK